MAYYRCDVHMICMNLRSLAAASVVVVITTSLVLFASHKEEKNQYSLWKIINKSLWSVIMFLFLFSCRFH